MYDLKRANQVLLVKIHLQSVPKRFQYVCVANLWGTEH